MGGLTAPSDPPPRPRYLRPLPPPDQQIELFPDHSSDRSDQIRSPDRDRRFALPRPVHPPGLDRHQARVVAWLERYAVNLTPKDNQPHPVHYDGPARPAFHGGRAFVLRFGVELVLQAIHELTYWRWSHVDTRYTRCWSDDIVSPARRLYAYVRDLDALSRNQADDRKEAGT
jgi:hypothetical protein